MDATTFTVSDRHYSCKNSSPLHYTNLGYIWILISMCKVVCFTVSAHLNLFWLQCQKNTGTLFHFCWNFFFQSHFCIWAIWLGPVASCSAEHEYKSKVPRDIIKAEEGCFKVLGSLKQHTCWLFFSIIKCLCHKSKSSVHPVCVAPSC